MEIETSATARCLRWPGFLLGLALGGFFDGILLHQILQWHHLLSNVDAVRDMRLQLLADGLFHALMYAVAAAAIARLWHRRGALAGAGAGRVLGGHALSGFGGWHIADGLLSHWITGIHRQGGFARSVDVGSDLVLRVRRPARRAGMAGAAKERKWRG